MTPIATALHVEALAGITLAFAAAIIVNLHALGAF